MAEVTFKKAALAAAVGGLMATGGAQAATVGYSMMATPYEDNLRTVDTPVDDATAVTSSNPLHSNYVAPPTWRNGSGALITAPNYGYAQGGGLPATWYVKIGGNDSASLNSNDRIAARQAGGFIGGAGADPIDYVGDEPTILQVGAGAFYDNGTNWGHNADYGLLTVTETSDVTISISGKSANFPGFTSSVQSKNLRPGFAVWEGWDTAGGTRHTTWLKNGYTPGGAAFAGDPTGASTVFPGALSMKQLGVARGDDSLGAWKGAAWTYTNGGTATLTLTNLAAGNYTLVLGGITHTGLTSNPPGSGAGGAQKEYSVAISSVAAVPVPAAVWLFGSALAGMGVIGRRRDKKIA